MAPIHQVNHVQRVNRVLLVFLVLCLAKIVPKANTPMKREQQRALTVAKENTTMPVLAVAATVKSFAPIVHWVTHKNNPGNHFVQTTVESNQKIVRATNTG